MKYFLVCLKFSFVICTAHIFALGGSTSPHMRTYQKRKNRVYRSGTDVGLLMLSVVKELKEGKHKNLSQAAQAIGVNRVTLWRYMNKFTEEEIESNCLVTTKADFHKNTVFTPDLEEELAHYISSDAYFSCSPEAVCKLAYQFALELEVKTPKNWEVNEKAGRDWFTSFIKRHPMLSVKMTRETSITRAGNAAIKRKLIEEEVEEVVTKERQAKKTKLNRRSPRSS